MSGAWNLEEPAPTAPRAPAGAAQAATAEVPPGAPSGWDAFTRLGYLLAGLLTIGLAFASFNPWFGFFLKDKSFHAYRWPWELFHGLDGPAFHWLPPQVYLLSLVFAGFALLACMLLRPGGLRAGLALTALVLVAVVVMPGPGEYMIVAGMYAALGLLAAGVWVGARAPRGGNGSRLLLAAVVATGAMAFLPMSDQDLLPDEVPERAPYISPATLSLRSLADVLGDAPPPVFEQGGEVRPMTLLDWAQRNLLNAPMLLALVVGLLALLGLGGRWAAVVMTLLLLTAVLGPPFEHAWRALAEYRHNTLAAEQTTVDAVSTFARNSAEAYLVGLRAACLPLALGVADLLRRRRAA